MSAVAAFATLPARRRLTAVVGSAATSAWEPLKLTRGAAGTLVAELGPRGGAAEAIAKIAGPAGAAAVRAEANALAALRPVAARDGWSPLLPELIACGDVTGGAYLVQRVVPGVSGRRLILAGGERDRITRVVVEGLGRVHAGATTQAVDDDALRRWLVDPAVFAAGALRGRRRRAALRRVMLSAASALRGRPVRVGWIHGDF